MADENLRSRHGFGSSENVPAALDAKKIDSHDILFLDEDTKPKIGWITKQGTPVYVDTEFVIVVDGETLPESGEIGKFYILKDEAYFWNGTGFVNLSKSTDLSALEEEIDSKANAEEVEAKLVEIESALDVVSNRSYTHEKIKYEITDVPVGTLVDYRDDEIRVMCPNNSEYHLQNVGVGGDSNTYYMTFKTYFPSEDVTGYREHLNDQVDAEILTSYSTDEYGRKYQPTWLGVAKYDVDSDTWTYFGANSTVNKYIGWDYQIDWYNADGVMIASDSIRINLSNEDCHSSIEPFYMNNVTAGVEEKVEEAVKTANTYTDEQIEAIINSMAIVEF